MIGFVPTSSSAEGYPALVADPGGAPGSFLAALTRYGGTGAMIGKVGADRFGRLLMETLNQAGIDTGGVIVDPLYFTTLVFITADEQGNRDFCFARKPGADTRLSAKEIDAEKIRNSRVFHFGTPSLTNEPVRSAVKHALAIAREGNLLVSLDPKLRKPLWPSEVKARTAMEWCLRQADIVKISDEEISFLWGTSPVEGVRRLLSSYGVSLVYATLGAKGCYAANRNGSVFVPSPAGIQAVDTSGAGDIFGGAAMSRFLRCNKAPGDLTLSELRQIVRFACAAASLSTRKLGSIRSIPPLEEVTGLLSRE